MNLLGQAYAYLICLRQPTDARMRKEDEKKASTSETRKRETCVLALRFFILRTNLSHSNGNNSYLPYLVS